MLTTSRNEQDTLFVTFTDFPPAGKLENTSTWSMAKRRIEAAGFTFEGYGLTDIVSRTVTHPSRFDGHPLQTTESIHCDPASLNRAAMTLDREALAELLGVAFVAYAQAKKAEEEETQRYREMAQHRPLGEKKGESV